MTYAIHFNLCLIYFFVNSVKFLHTIKLVNISAFIHKNVTFILYNRTVIFYVIKWKFVNVFCGATALKSQDQLKWLLPDGSTGDLAVSKALSLNLNFSFLNRILLHLISSSYPIDLTRLGEPHSGTYTSRKISRLLPGIEPGTSRMTVRCANHYTKQTVAESMYLY